jgi:hypothetical protein
MQEIWDMWRQINTIEVLEREEQPAIIMVLKAKEMN